MAVARMLPHDLPFLIRQLPLLQENGIRHADLPDVVEQTAPVDFPEIAYPFIVMRCQEQRMRRDPLGMKSGFPLSQVQGFGEGFNEHVIREMFVKALAEALDLRERETGLHSKRVATHT